MSTLIITLGHGGGVPMGTGNGNTNFAVVPGYNNDLLSESGQSAEGRVRDILAHYPWYLVDCGPETMLWLCSSTEFDSPVLANLKGIFITHTHDDHCGGLNSLAWRLFFVQKACPVPLYTAEGNINGLVCRLFELKFMNSRVLSDRHRTQELLEGAPSWPTRFPLDAFYVANSRDSARFGEDNEHRFEWFPVDHNIVNFPSYALRMKLDSGREFNAHRVTFSGDTAYPLAQSLIDHSDAVYHDVQTYLDPPDGYEVHCPLSSLSAAVPEESREKIIVLTAPRRR